ncbi:MAG TPA: TIGR01777 family oxidoreductase, partial [Anaerolineae bacterium]
GEGFPPDRWTSEKKRRIRQSRIDAGNAVVEAVAAATNKPAVVIQASGVDYYGNRGDEVLTEESAPGDTFLASVALDWEGATAPVEGMGVRRVVTRSGIVLSMEGGALPSTVLPFKLFVGGPLGSGRQWWPWICIRDEVRAIRFLIENESASGPVIVCTPNPLRNKDFARVIGQVMGRPSFMPVPAFALKLALGEVADTVLHSRRTIPEKLQELGFTFLYPELKAALEDLL